MSAIEAYVIKYMQVDMLLVNDIIMQIASTFKSKI